MGEALHEAGDALQAAVAAPARAAVVIYCSADEKVCRDLVTPFTKEAGIKAAITRQSSGETFARIRDERENPRADVWWAGTGDPHLQAAEQRLTEECRARHGRRPGRNHDRRRLLT